MPLFRHLLVPFDFSPLAEHGVRYALDLAETHDARVTVLHVTEDPAFPSFYKLGALRIYGMVPDMEKVAWGALEKRFGNPGDDPRLDFRVARGPADATIVRVAAEEEVDLIVLTSHGLTGLEHVLMGHVAEKVVRLCPCPVLVVKVMNRQPHPVEGVGDEEPAGAA